jgi:hypothetical protein
MLASEIDAHVWDEFPEFALSDPAHTSIIAERASLMPERWWIHCVSNRIAGEDDLATCLGVAMLAKPTVILFAATHGITASARRFASQVNATTGTRFLALDKDDLDRIKTSPDALPDLLRERLMASATTV